MNSPKMTLINKGIALKLLKRVDVLSESQSLALDIGGSLAKIIYFQPDGANRRKEKTDGIPKLCIDYLDPKREGSSLSVRVPELNGTLHFFCFETRNIEDCIKFISEHYRQNGKEKRRVRATGGGSYKYDKLFSEVGVELTKLDEMCCTVAGLTFLLTHFDHEVFSFLYPDGSLPPPGLPESAPALAECRRFVDARPDPFPYLLVHIGSGVSIVKVTGHGQFERVSGSTIGGGTFWGLCRLLTNCKTFDEIIDLTKEGNNERVDMLVGDIYGGDYSKVGLGAGVIASSFGKVTMRKEPPPTFSNLRKAWRRVVCGTFWLWCDFMLNVPILGHFLRRLGLEKHLRSRIANIHFGKIFRAEDVALSLLRMISYNIGQIGYLNAKRYDLPRIYFGGNFIRDHPYTIASISYAVHFWSNGQTQALFLLHDGYLGALGAFLGGESTISENSYSEL
ncbi:hypothetical protein GpartN1_g2781.t1 [Galdieria partita]|uniref:Pantothenate kinase n=1 Tax=Galdieria partita TaxID=83374 RepID=A0A9C7PVS4_9RHOD|nr:hypothetical protein GpartN1_g2288.t1 [Galdieria partita]GJQ10990.1 hypothetical protein GpartN1_g2781.t1 [Galdieria partita]